MKGKKSLSLAAVLAILSLVIGFAGAGTAMGQQQQKSMTVQPTGGCPGDPIVVSGTGAYPGQELDVIGEPYPGFEGMPVYYLVLGSVMTDESGNWSLSTTVPHSAIRTEDDSMVPIGTGKWTLALDIMDPEYPMTTFDVTECPESVQSDAYVVVTSLPSTGLPVAALASLLGAGLLTSAGIAIRKASRQAK